VEIHPFAAREISREISILAFSNYEKADKESPCPNWVENNSCKRFTM
jgi:hypothetical protein